MVKDTEYKEPDFSKTENKPGDQPIPISVLDGVIAKEPASVIISKLGSELGLIRNLAPKEAIEKYGEAGKNGATEIYTRKKAAELGIKVPFRREGPDDFPTFQGGNQLNFASWIADQVKYPAEASSQGIKGRVSVGFKIEPDGSLTEIKPMGTSDPLLISAVVKAIQSAPKWDCPKNPEVTDPYSSFVNLKFELPDKVTVDNTYVVVEQMPQFPGGDGALLNYIKDNVKYPEGLKSEKISGRVIVRFIVNSDGNTEEVLILKGVHPLLDAEALRVVSSITGWQPGMQGGKAVNVWYMVPVNFTAEQN
jgi:TonB family protein